MTEMQDTIILLDKASRRFGRRDALKGIDLQVRAGTMLGLIGPNGSGKTTLLKLMAGFIKTTSGTVRMFGYDPFTHRMEVMRRARFAFAPPPIYGALSAFEHLKFLSAAGVRQSERVGRREIMQALETVGLAQRAHDKASTFSFGMKQRLGLAQALLPLPELLVFDEPTDGLDPLAVAELRGTLKRLHSEYTLTIVLSSHLLSEVEKLVDTLLALNEGGVIYCGTPAGLLDGGRRIEMRIEGKLEAGIGALRRHGFNPEINGDNRLMLPVGSIRLQDAAKLMKEQGLRLIEFHEKRPGLADAYLQRLKDGFERSQLQGKQ
jgi:ABC-2 type transport system ATP-binding protein